MNVAAAVLAPQVCTATVDPDASVLPPAITAGHPNPVPRFGDDVWDVAPFVPRTTRSTRIDFTTFDDAGQARTAKEYLYSRIHRAIAANQLSGTTRPMKITGLCKEFWEVRVILRDLAAAGAPDLARVTRQHLDRVLTTWKRRPDTAAGLVGVVKHLAAHGPFLTDRLTITPWPGRGANLVAGRRTPRENTTPRIPEHIIGPLIKAAVFYVETAARDLLAARDEIAALQAARRHIRYQPGQVKAALETFISRRREQGRGIPAVPREAVGSYPDAPVLNGIPQAPNAEVIGLLSGVGSTWYHRDLLHHAGTELGYEQGGLDTDMSTWPDTGRPWRARLDPWSLKTELFHLRTAAWITIAYLSGMRDVEIRELARDCAFTEPGADGRTRHKIRGRVFKDRRLAGDEAQWVVLDVVHRAVDVLLAVNDDPTHLFGRSYGDRGHALLGNMQTRLARYSAHVDSLFTNHSHELIPDDSREPDKTTWPLTTGQFRRTLAWHIAHQPFGVVAGARQYKHAHIAVFEGYAGTSTSGFAAEVAAEQVIAQLDYVEDLYRDWLHDNRSGGGANAGINAEFERIRHELADLPGTIADPARLRTMLDHLSTTVHPGVLGDCFYRPETALCTKQAKPPGKPLPMLNTCLSCPNARRSSIHLPRLEQARDQARQIIDHASSRPTPPLQHAALTGHLHQLDQLIGQITNNTTEKHDDDQH
jgi:hypothetical protein